MVAPSAADDVFAEGALVPGALRRESVGDVANVPERHREALSEQRVLVSSCVADEHDAGSDRRRCPGVAGGERRARAGDLGCRPPFSFGQAAERAGSEEPLGACRPCEAVALSGREAVVEAGAAVALREGEEEQVALTGDQVDALVDAVEPVGEQAGDEVRGLIQLESDLHFPPHR